jgi:hypothetical protein
MVCRRRRLLLHQIQCSEATQIVWIQIHGLTDMSSSTRSECKLSIATMWSTIFRWLFCTFIVWSKLKSSLTRVFMSSIWQSKRLKPGTISSARICRHLYLKMKFGEERIWSSFPALAGGLEMQLCAVLYCHCCLESLSENSSSCCMHCSNIKKFVAL